MPSLAEVCGVLDERYDPSTAESWDAVGLVCGDPEAPVRRVMFTIDPAPAVLDRALGLGIDLVVAHHPLLLTPVHGVPATTVKGRAVHRLITGGAALLTAHTNADVASPGVNDALAAVLGLHDTAAVVPGAVPGTGLGRVGRLDRPMTLAELGERVVSALPLTAAGVRLGGDLTRTVETVAVCGGSGDSLLATVADLGVDAYVTSDLRHHRASEHLEAGGPALVDVPHWAGEWPWLPAAARLLVTDLLALGATVDVTVSDLVTDPWSVRL